MRRWVVLGVLVCVAGAGLGMEGSAAAEPAPPKLKAVYRERDDAVRLSWRVRGIDRKAVTIIEIERALEGAAFASLDAVPRRPSRYDDAPEAGGTYYYRARVISDDEVSGWSGTVSVEVPEPASGGGGGGGNPALPSDQRECPAGTVDQVLAIVNQHRQANGRAALRLQSQLQWAARTRTIKMADEGKLSHDGWDRVIDQSGYRWSAIAENIALGPTTPAGVMNLWMGSTGHRNNILGGYLDIGIGCVIDRNGFYWWTQDFGR